MKTKLLKKIRKEYSIADKSGKLQIHLLKEGVKSSIWYWDYFKSNKDSYEEAVENSKRYLIYLLRKEYPKLGYYNRGNKIWHKK